MMEVHRQSVPIDRRTDKMFPPEGGGGLRPPVNTGLSLGINGLEQTEPANLTPNTGYVPPMISMRTPLPNATAFGHETAASTGVAALDGNQSAIPAPYVVPVGNEDFLSAVSGNQAVFSSVSAEMPLSAPLTGIGAQASVAPDVLADPLEGYEATIFRAHNNGLPQEAFSIGVALNAEVPTAKAEPPSKLAAEQVSQETSSADLNIGYGVGEAQVVHMSPIEVETLQLGVETQPINDDGFDDKAVFQDDTITTSTIPVEMDDQPPSLCGETQPINDDGFDDKAVFQDDTITTSTIPVEMDDQPPSLCEPVQIISIPPLEPMFPPPIAISERKVSNNSGEPQVEDIQGCDEKHLSKDSDQLPAFEGIIDSGLLEEGFPSSGVEEKCEEEGLNIAEPQTGLLQAASLEEEEKKGHESTLTGNFGIPSTDKTEVSTEPHVQAIIGRKVAKKFGRKTFKGEVIGYDNVNQWFKVLYEDGDEEDLELAEVKELLLVEGDAVSDISPEKRKRSSAKGGSGKQARKPKATSQGSEKPRARPKKKGSSDQTKQSSQKAKPLQELKQKSSEPKASPLKIASTGVENKVQPQVKSGRKRQRSSDSEIAIQGKAGLKTKKAGSSLKKGGRKAIKDPFARKGVKHQSLSDLPTDPNSGKRRKVDAGDDPESFVGRLVEKDFGGTRYKGKVINFGKKTGYFKVKYDDGDQEDLEWEELKAVME